MTNKCFNIDDLTVNDTAECGHALRAMGVGADSMEEVAGRVVGYLYDTLCDGANARACALVRFFKTHDFGKLDSDLQGFARTFLDTQKPSDAMKCLTLLASAGDEPSWNDRRQSQGHKTIPLPSEDFVHQFPMISNLITQLGLDVSRVLKSDLEMVGTGLNVFFVPKALGSPLIHAQDDFVIPFDIKSVVGFGGLTPGGDMYAVIMFFKMAVPPAVAYQAPFLADNVKKAIEPFESRVFIP